MDIMTVVILMTAVTYIPRLLPMYFFNEQKIPPALKRFLSCIPYAALGALIFPGSIGAVSGKPLVSVLAIAVAAVTAWYNRNIIITVFVTVAATYVFILMGI